MITIIAVNAAIPDFYNLLTAPRTVSNTHAEVARAQWRAIMCNTSRVYHVQYVVCQVVLRDSSEFITCNMSCVTWY